MYTEDSLLSTSKGENISYCDETIHNDFQYPCWIKVAFPLIIVCILPLGVVGNSIMCYVIYHKQPMRSSINLLLAHHAFANMVFLIICTPFTFVSLVTDTWIFGEVMCTLIAYLHTCLSGLITYILMVISIDRYLIIVHMHDSLVPDRIWKIHAFCWIFCFALPFPCIFGVGKFSYFSGWPQCVLGDATLSYGELYCILVLTLLYYLPFLVMTCSYILIIRKVHHNKVKVSHVPEQHEVRTVSTAGRYKPVQMDMSFKTKSLNTLLIIYVMWVLAWIPYAVCIFVWNIQLDFENKLGGVFLIMLGYVGAGTNPVVFVWRIPRLREAFKELLPKTSELLPSLSQKTNRRINPSSIYEVKD